MKKTMEIELLTIKTERDACAAKQRESELKLKDLERLWLALEWKTETEIEEFKKEYEWEREIEWRHFD